MPGWQGQRGTRQQRGYGANWDRLRKVVMARDKGLCQPCRAADRVTIASEVDHITPKSAGGTDDLDNLQAICAACHKTKTAEEGLKAQGSGFRKRMRYDAKGFPVWET